MSGIPPELLVDILARVAVKDLVRFTSVCKSWRSLIVSPSFISLHSAAQKDVLLVRSCRERCSENPEGEQYSIHLDDGTFGVYKRLDFPFQCSNPCFRIIGCINGVLCLSDDLYSYNQVIILWNPSIRRYVSLPEPIADYSSHGPYMQEFGFGINPTTGDYKVVRLVYGVDDSGCDEVPPEVEVCDMGAKSWRSVDSKGLSCVVEHRTKQSFLNGAIHWAGTKHKSRLSVIVTFDMENEALGTIKVPDAIADRLRIDVTVVGESLSLIYNDKSLDGRGSSICSIWVMKQYGVPETWSKLYAIALPVKLFHTFGFLKNGELLGSTTMHSPLASCEPGRMQAKDLGIFGFGEYVCVEKFVESLSLIAVGRESWGKLSPHYLKHGQYTKTKIRIRKRTKAGNTPIRVHKRTKAGGSYFALEKGRGVVES